MKRWTATVKMGDRTHQFQALGESKKYVIDEQKKRPGELISVVEYIKSSESSKKRVK